MGVDKDKTKAQKLSHELTSSSSFGRVLRLLRVWDYSFKIFLVSLLIRKKKIVELIHPVSYMCVSFTLVECPACGTVPFRFPEWDSFSFTDDFDRAA